MVKKISAIFLIIALSFSLLAGCNVDISGKQMKVKIKNSSGYMFNELYLSPSASTEWGEDKLGSTSVLKKGGSVELELEEYDFNTYDIRVVDEDEDIYLFARVPLENASEIDVVWGDDLAVNVTYQKSQSVTVIGIFESGRGGGYVGDDSELLEVTLTNETGWDLTEVYVYASGADDYGYNHVSDTPLSISSQCVIGVTNYVNFDIGTVDANGSVWKFRSVYLEHGCFATVNFNESDGAFLYVLYSDGSEATYAAELL